MKYGTGMHHTWHDFLKNFRFPAILRSPFYLIFEIWFDSQSQMDEVLGSAAWKAVREDVKNFATGGVTALLSKIEM